MSNLFYTKHDRGLTVFIDGKSAAVSDTHPQYDTILAALKAKDFTKARQLMTVADTINSAAMDVAGGDASKQRIFVEKGKVWYRDRQSKVTELEGPLVDRIIDAIQKGLTEKAITPLVMFLDNVMKNKLKDIREELYLFMMSGHMPITNDGHFLAYKKIRANYTDCYSGKMDNSVGKVVEMERNHVDDNKEVTCSAGLHFCGMTYLAHFGGARTVIVKVNPRDVVSIPVDYNNAKARACRYEVIGELNVAPEDAFVKPVQETAVGSAWPFPIAEVAPAVTSGPKEGDTPFYAGYTAGYTGSVNSAVASADRVAYNEGYSKGVADASKGSVARYIYKGAVVATPQDYDKYGRPLSMTKDAIRKRQLRAAAKSTPKVVAQPAKSTGLWPQPKGF